MTNAEKFKEVFGFKLEYQLADICPYVNNMKCVRDDDAYCSECQKDYWESEYKARGKA